MTAGDWVIVLAVGIGGFGLGIGLVVGAFVARALRRYMRDEGMGNGRNHRHD